MNLEQQLTVWMRCPYDDVLCGADATLDGFDTTTIDGWTGTLTCANGHVFVLTQYAREDT